MSTDPFRSHVPAHLASTLCRSAAVVPCPISVCGRHGLHHARPQRHRSAIPHTNGSRSGGSPLIRAQFLPKASCPPQTNGPLASAAVPNSGNLVVEEYGFACRHIIPSRLFFLTVS